MTDPVTYELRGNVALVTIDNGKANVITPDVVAGFDAALSRAESAGPDEVGALVIAGTPGFLSGGFDLSIMMSSAQAAGSLVTDGGAFFTRAFASPVPVIGACTGHAVAAGALLLLACDERIGAEGDYKIGLIETAKGMVLPRWAIELAEERLSRRHFQVATVGARMYAPAGARDAGFVDTLVPVDQVVDAALAAAATWAALPRAAYAGQVAKIRGERVARLEAAVAADRGAVFGLA